jgi:phosphoglycolate phosphatase-like HAD superfamily hydrolase
MFGDDERDMEAALNAGVKPILITKENNLLKAVKEYINKED